MSVRNLAVAFACLVFVKMWLESTILAQPLFRLIAPAGHLPFVQGGFWICTCKVRPKHCSGARKSCRDLQGSHLIKVFLIGRLQFLAQARGEGVNEGHQEEAVELELDRRHHVVADACARGCTRRICTLQ